MGAVRGSDPGPHLVGYGRPERLLPSQGPGGLGARAPSGFRAGSLGQRGRWGEHCWRPPGWGGAPSSRRCTPSCSSILSHWSSTKCLTPRRLRLRPGVPTITCGRCFFSTSPSFLMDRPRKNTDTCGTERRWPPRPPHPVTEVREPTLTPGMYLEKRSYSLLIWKASSRVWHVTRTVTWEQDSAAQGPAAPGPNPRDQRRRPRPAPTCALTSSICCGVASMNTAILPMPDLAWHRTSTPGMAWGMHSCWTAGGRAGQHAAQGSTAGSELGWVRARAAYPQTGARSHSPRGRAGAHACPPGLIRWVWARPPPAIEG